MKFIFSFFIFCAVCISSSGPLQALTVIRDTETQNLLNDYVRQIFKTGGLPEQNVEVILLSDASINAFVAYGQTIFVHTGLILNAEHPDDLMFVLAHETGHILAGHIVSGIEQYKTAQKTAWISGIIGGLAGIAAGRPDAGIAVLIGSQSAGLGLFSSYRQTQESAADKIAMDILNKLGYSTNGFKNIMRKIQAQERISVSGEIPPYLQTHPLTQDRLKNLTQSFEQEKPLKKDPKFDRVRAKLASFLLPLEQVKSLSTGTDIPARYARAIYDYRKHDLKQALTGLDKLILQEPENPYFHELKGQFLFESGQFKEAEKAYKKALSFAPQADLIRIALAQVLLETEDTQNAEKALEHLQKARLAQDSDAFLWRLTATAYNQLGKNAYTQWAMSEYLAASGKILDAQKRAKNALRLFEKQTDTSLEALAVQNRLNDIMALKQPEKN